MSVKLKDPIKDPPRHSKYILAYDDTGMPVIAYITKNKVTGRITYHIRNQRNVQDGQEFKPKQWAEIPRSSS